MVECFLAKEDVAGSTPVSRSKRMVVCDTLPTDNLKLLSAYCREVRMWMRIEQMRRGTQVVRERSAKPLCVGSIPTRASKIFFNEINRLNNPYSEVGYFWATNLSNGFNMLIRFDPDPRLQKTFLEKMMLRMLKALPCFERGACGLARES